MRYFDVCLTYLEDGALRLHSRSLIGASAQSTMFETKRFFEANYMNAPLPHIVRVVATEMDTDTPGKRYTMTEWQQFTVKDDVNI